MKTKTKTNEKEKESTNGKQKRLFFIFTTDFWSQLTLLKKTMTSQVKFWKLNDNGNENENEN